MRATESMIRKEIERSRGRASTKKFLHSLCSPASIRPSFPAAHLFAAGMTRTIARAQQGRASATAAAAAATTTTTTGYTNMCCSCSCSCICNSSSSKGINSNSTIALLHVFSDRRLHSSNINRGVSEIHSTGAYAMCLELSKIDLAMPSLCPF